MISFVPCFQKQGPDVQLQGHAPADDSGIYVFENNVWLHIFPKTKILVFETILKENNHCRLLQSGQ